MGMKIMYFRFCIMSLALTSFLSFAGQVKKSDKSPKIEVTQADLKSKTGDKKKDTDIPEGGALVVPQGEGYFPGSCGYRKAIGGLVKIYHICFFGKNAKATDWTSVFESNSKFFKFKLSFLRGIGGKKVSAAFSEGFSKIPSENKLEELERQKFIKWSSDLKIDRDSVLEITFNDSIPLHVEFHEKANEQVSAVVFESKQKSLAKSLAGIWLGSKPVSEELKSELLKEAN